MSSDTSATPVAVPIYASEPAAAATTVHARPAAAADSDAAFLYVSIIPGTDILRIQSMVDDPVIQAYSKAVLQIAMTMFLIQVLWIIVFLVATSNPGSADVIINFVISLMISIFILYCAVTGVRYKNPVCCCGFGYLDFYRSWCIIGGVFSIFYIILGIVVGSLFTVIFNLLYLFLYLLGERRTRTLLQLLLLFDENGAVNAHHDLNSRLV